MTPNGFARLDRHLVVSFWSATACAPPVVVVDQQFIQLATAQIPFLSREPVPFTAVEHERVMDVFKRVSAIHVLLIILTSWPCPSSLARAFFPASCHTSSCSGACRTGTVQLLSQRIDPRTLLDWPTSSTMFSSSTHSRVPKARRQLALWV